MPLRHGSQQGRVCLALPGLSRKTSRLLRLWTDEMHVRYSPRTVETYLSHVRSFVLWLLSRGVELGEARAQDLEAYHASLMELRKDDEKPYASETQCGRLRAVKTLYRFLYRRSYVLSDPAAALEMPRREQRLPRVILTTEEVARILLGPRGTSPRDLRDRAILETLYGTGIRVSELINLTTEDVDTDERVLRVVRGKGGKDRNLPLTSAAAEAIEAYLVKGRALLLRHIPLEALFVGGYGRKLQRGTVSVIVRGWARKARVRKPVTAHVFRHSFATHLLRGRADIRHIQALLGHKCLSSTERYTRVEVSDLRKVLERAHPRGR